MPGASLNMCVRRENPGGAVASTRNQERAVIVPSCGRTRQTEIDP